jgi:hypothetical protein
MKEGEVVDFLAHLNESQQRQVLALIEAMKRETA